MRVNRRWVTWLGTAVIALAFLTVLLWMGPAGSAWQANDDFAACVTRAESMYTYRIEGEVNPEYVSAMSECAQYCEPIDDPSWLETVGLFAQTRASTGQEGPSCVPQPGFSDIIPFLPGEDTDDVSPPLGLPRNIGGARSTGWEHLQDVSEVGDDILDLRGEHPRRRQPIRVLCEAA